MELMSEVMVLNMSGIPLNRIGYEKAMIFNREELWVAINLLETNPCFFKACIAHVFGLYV